LAQLRTGKFGQFLPFSDAEILWKRTLNASHQVRCAVWASQPRSGGLGVTVMHLYIHHLNNNIRWQWAIISGYEDYLFISRYCGLRRVRCYFMSCDTMRG